MDRDDLIASFQDTLTFSITGEIRGETKRSAASSKVYHENFRSGSQIGSAECRVVVSANTSFAEARKFAGDGRAAVLNFANPVTPGGGVKIGAIAQEECLCRSSNLYYCIGSRHLYDEYYGYHIRQRSNFYSDRLIYTRDVLVFKDDSLLPVMLPRKNRFHVDVITCAAPYLGESKYIAPTVLEKVFQSRITNIMEAALDNKADTIILGAFGCGAFKNPAGLVAGAFRSVIENGQYCRKFRNIVFAIKKKSERDYGDNYRAFADVFGYPCR